MEIFLEQWEKRVKTNPNKVIITDGEHLEGFTCREIDILADKVSAYLQRNGFKQDDIVLNYLPRGYKFAAAMLGEWKAGVAFVNLESETTPLERFNFIYSDSGAKLILNDEIWQKIIQEKPLYGHKQIDAHAAAFVVYTSGTSGRPKGVLHERGIVREMLQSLTWEGKSIFPPVPSANIAPFSFAIGIIGLIVIFNEGGKLEIVPYHIVKNLQLFKDYIISRSIGDVFMPPSMALKMGDFPTVCKNVIVAGEAAYGFYIEGVNAYNPYASSETMAAMCLYKIDKRYDGVVPVGRPQENTPVYILDDNDKEVKKGEIGEFCRKKSPYTRGYINLPSENATVFRNGIYHTGDLAQQLSDGNYVIVGRKDDMVNINGNRVEPGEIEAILRKQLKLKSVAVRGVVTDKASFVCSYYTDNIIFDEETARKKLAAYLPAYMIPAYFVKLQVMPCNANGKVVRRELPLPNIENYRGKFVAPANALEQKICDAFAKVLKQPQFSAADDFFKLGGDSLGAVAALAEINIENLTSVYLYRGRTPQKIAALYNNESNKKVKPLQLQEGTLIKPLDMQWLMIESNILCPKQSYSYMCVQGKLGNNINVEKFTAAVNKVLRYHPGLAMMPVQDKKGKLLLRYSPELLPTVKVEDISDNKLRNIRSEFTKPFVLFKELLLRARILRTKKETVLLLYVHHALVDGNAVSILLKNIERCYRGMPLPVDNYSQVVAERLAEQEGGVHKECQNYVMSSVNAHKWVNYFAKDGKIKDCCIENIYHEYAVNHNKLTKKLAIYGVSESVFYIAVTILAVAVWNRKKNIMLMWTYDNRGEVAERNTVGIMIRDIPIMLTLKPEMSLQNFFDGIKEQIVEGIEHSAFSYERYYREQLRKSKKKISHKDMQFPMLVITVQNPLVEETVGMLDIFEDFCVVNDRYNLKYVDYGDVIMSLEFHLGDSNSVGVDMDYSTDQYKTENIHKMQQLINKLAHRLILKSVDNNTKVSEVLVEFQHYRKN